jgi:peptidoglycan/xylan/chitin deacetylase (PgdA/CDA1 family)
MSALKYGIIKTAFELLSISKIPNLIRHFSSCRGIIFTLHRVLPDAVASFQPNAILQITPEFLEEVIIKTRKSGFDIVNLDEAVRRISSDEKEKPFIVFTFDDAYKDNLTFALPILKKHNCPFTLFVPTGFVDGKGELWWQVLEDIIQNNEIVTFDDNEFLTASTSQKQKAFEIIYWQMRDMPEQRRIEITQIFAAKYNIDMFEHCQQLIMDWQELKIFANEPLCTIGAHTINHFELAKLSNDEAKSEMQNSADILEKKFAKRPKHFSYPIGAIRSASEREYNLVKEIGFTTGVTTLPGGLYSKHQNSLSNLPRVSLNGYFQKSRYLDVFLTGAIFSR